VTGETPNGIIRGKMKKLSQDQKDELDKIIIQSDELKKGVRIRVKKSEKKPKFEKKSKSEKLSIFAKISESDKDHVNLGSLVKKSSKKEPSEFRKKSAHWRDGEKVVLEDQYEADEQIQQSELLADEATLLDKIKSYGPLQWAALGMAAVVFVTSIMTTSVYANYKGEQNKAIAFAELPTYVDMADSDLAAVAEEVVEEVEPIAAEEPQQVEGSVLSLVMTSVEKDLKIKLVDAEDTLVKGVNWGVTVADDKNNQSTYNDDDTDGIIHITDISAGDYSVTINSSDSLNGYTIPSTSSQVSVKAKVEYKVIANIKDEIKSEKEVNAAAEDANGNQAADVETGTKLTDTVEWCESTKTESGERYVEASVDLSKCTAKATVGGYIITSLRRLISNSKHINIGNAAMVRLVASENQNDEQSQTGDNQTNTHDHSYSSFTWDNNTHYKKCTVEGCNEKSDSGNCEYGTPISNGDGTHKKTCSVCGHDVQENCTYVDGKCTLCGAGEPSNSVAITGIKLDKTALSLVIGQSSSLKATVEPSNASGTGLAWSSSNSSVATVSGGTVTAVTSGTATITVSSSDGAKSATCEVTVTASSSSDKNYNPASKLYDSAGNVLYKKSGDGYAEAKYQDILDGVSQFFRKETGYIYTGWQTINNQTYYYKSDHSYVTGDQVIGGVLYHFASDGALTKGSGTLGIDVSKYQPSINWASVKASGVSYVIIRCGYRGASTGALIQDPYYVSHIKGAKAAGLKVGVYFFSTALTEAEAVEEASMCAALCSGYGINYPVFIDVESSSRPGYNGLSAAQRTANIKAFCNTIKSAGYTPGVYANKTWFTSYINTSQLSGYKIWLAQYNAAGPTYSGRYDLWQYTSKGSVNGISGNVDMNQSYLGY